MAAGTSLNIGLNLGMNNKGFMSGLKQVTQGLGNALKPSKKGKSDKNDKGILDAIKDNTASTNLGNTIQAFAKPTQAALGVANQIIGQMGELTTSYEDKVFHLGVTSRKAAMGMTNDVGKQKKIAKEMTNMSLEMNMDIAVITKAYQELEATKIGEKGGVLDRMGLNLKDVLKIADVSGASAAELIDTFASMQQQLGIAPEEIAKMADKMAYVGREFSMGNEAIAELPKLIKAGGAIFAKFAKNSPQDAQKILESTFALEAGYRRMGMSATDASTAAQSSMKLQMGEQQTVERMFTGLETNLGKFSQDLAIGQGDIKQTFADLKKNPAEFAQAMVQMYKTAKDKNGGKLNVTMEQFLQNVGDAVPELKLLITNADKAQKGIGEAVEAMADKDGKTKGALKATSKAWSDSRTAADRYQRILDLFNTDLRQNGTSQEEYLTLIKSGYDHLGKKVGKIVKKGGPMAELVRETMDLEKFGPKSLFPKAMWAEMDQLGTMLPKFGKFAVVWKQMGGSFGSLFGPAGAIAAGAIVFGAHWSNLIDAMMAGAKKAGKTMDIWTAARATFDKALSDVKAWAHKAMDMIQQGIKWIAVQLAKINWTETFAEALTTVHEFLVCLFGFSKGDEKTIAGHLAETLKQALNLVAGLAWDIGAGAISGWWKAITDIWDDTKTPLLTKMGEYGVMIAAALWGASLASSGFSGLVGGIASLLGALIAPIGTAIGLLLTPLGAIVATILVVVGILYGLKKAYDSIGETTTAKAADAAGVGEKGQGRNALKGIAERQKSGTLTTSDIKFIQERLKEQDSAYDADAEKGFKMKEAFRKELENDMGVNYTDTDIGGDNDAYRALLGKMTTQTQGTDMAEKARLARLTGSPTNPYLNASGSTFAGSPNYVKPAVVPSPAAPKLPEIKNITVNSSPELLAQEEKLVEKQIKTAKDNSDDLATLLARQIEILADIKAQGGGTPKHTPKTKANVAGVKANK